MNTNRLTEHYIIYAEPDGFYKAAEIITYFNAPGYPHNRPATVGELVRAYVLGVADGRNKTEAAKMLGIDRRTLYRMLERYKKENFNGFP